MENELKHFRENILKASQERLAEDLDLSREKINRIEKGKLPVSKIFAEKVKAKYGYDITVTSHSEKPAQVFGSKGSVGDYQEKYIAILEKSRQETSELVKMVTQSHQMVMETGERLKRELDELATNLKNTEESVEGAHTRIDANQLFLAQQFAEVLRVPQGEIIEALGKAFVVTLQARHDTKREERTLSKQT